jgi:hypothetical protein
MKTFAQQHQPVRAFFQLQQQQKGPDVPPPAAATQPAPPVTERTSEVVGEQDKARRDAGRRKGYKASLLAGETGGFNSGFSNTVTGRAAKSLLGQ